METIGKKFQKMFKDEKKINIEKKIKNVNISKLKKKFKNKT